MTCVGLRGSDHDAVFIFHFFQTPFSIQIWETIWSLNRRKILLSCFLPLMKEEKRKQEGYFQKLGSVPQTKNGEVSILDILMYCFIVIDI
jgi:hypothetical protein